MARTIEEIRTDLKTRFPILTDIVNGKVLELSSTEYAARIEEMAQDILAREIRDENETTETNNAKAIVVRLRNNTATNDDRNKAILWLIRQVRRDI